jgi:hypothetical protein
MHGMNIKAVEYGLYAYYLFGALSHVSDRCYERKWQIPRRVLVHGHLLFLQFFCSPLSKMSRQKPCLNAFSYFAKMLKNNTPLARSPGWESTAVLIL